MPVVIAAIFLVGALPARAKPEVPGTPLPEPLTPNG
jgi:hypothetical protein